MSTKQVLKHPRWLHSKPEDFVAPKANTKLVEREELPDLGLPRVVLIDGHLQRHLSDDVSGLRVLPLDEKDDVIEAHLGKAQDDDEVARVQLECFEGGVLLDAKADCEIHLIHLTNGASLDRTLVHARDGVTIKLCQQFIGSGTTNAVTELQAHTGAQIHRDLLSEMSGKILHSTFTTSDRDATVADVHIDISGSHRRNTTVARLSGKGAHVELGGLYMTAGKDHSDHWTRVDHTVPDTTSKELYKGVLAGSSRGSFTGNVMVRQDAQRTNAEQENRNLLLSRKALAESTPQLEILADDVQCSHGSTVGQLDAKALFFLRARGIGKEQAEAMLTKAFAGEVVDMLALPTVREEVSARIETWFSQRNSGGK